MKRALKYALVTSAALLVALAGAVWFVAATETGTGLLWRQARGFLPEGTQVRSLDGRLTGPLVVQGVELRTATMHLALERAELEWSPRALLTGLVHIERLELDGVHITQTGTPPEPEPAEPFELPEQIDPPAAVRLDALRLRDFAFRAAPGTDPFRVTRAGLTARLDRDGLVVDRVTLRSPLGDLDGRASVEPRGDYPVEGRLNWRVRPPGYAPADATTRLSGTLRALVVDQEIGAPYNFQARVNVADVLREPRFDGELAVSDTALAAIGGELPPATVSADAGFRGTAADLELNANLRGRMPEYGAVRAEIRGGLADQTFTLEQLLVERPETPARARADGVIRLAGAQPDMDVNLQWEALRWPLDGEAAVTSREGRATVSGTPQDLSFQIQGQTQSPDVGAFDLSLDGRLAGQVVELGQVRLAEQEGPATLSASGQVTLADGGPGVDLTAEWQRVRWPLGGGEPVVTSPSGSVTVQGSLQDVTARLDAGLGEAGRITGDISRRKQHIDVALDWQTLTWPLTGSEPGVTSPRGRIQLSGTLEDYDLSLDARVDVPEHTGGRVVLEGAGSLEAVELERIDVNALEGTLSGTARARWSPALDVAVDLRGDGLNPAPVLAGWPGKLGLDIKGRARMEDGRWHAQLERAEADGVLRGYDVDLDAQGGYDGGTLSLERLSLASGGTRVSAQGEIGESLDLEWRINSDDLGQLLPEAGGRVDGAGTARGSLRRPTVEADLEGEGLRYQGYSAATLDLDASIDAGGEENSELSLTIENGSAAGVEIDRVQLTGSGNARAHSLELAAQTSSGTADLAVTGTVENPWQADAAWVGELDRATLDYPELAPWRLQQAAAVRIDAARASVSRHCWQSGTARLCLEGERAASGLAARFELDRLDFDYFASLLPRNLRVEGAVGGSGRVSQAAEGPLAATVDLRTTSGRIGTADTGSGAADDAGAGEAPSMVAFRESDIRFELGEQGLQAEVDMRLEQGGFRLQASVPGDGAPFLERPLNGRITTEVPELSFIAELIPDLEEIDGRLEGDMKLAGSLGAPVLQGELALIGGTAVLSAPGLTLSDVRINLIGKGEGGLRLDATAKSGGGTLEVEGEADLTGEAAVASIAITGRDFQVFNTAEAQVYASPDLTVSVDRERIDITGEVAIPRADITPHKIPASAVTVSGDQVIVEPGSEELADSPGRAADRPIHSQVRVVLGERVRVDGFGLKARFEGDLRVIEKPGEPITGSGEIQIVEGQYKAYGQDLTIEEGRILFPGGPITEPGLDVRAVRRPREDILVGVKVRGNLREPKFTLFSEPAMTQQEQLSYLVLGRSLQESSGAESSAINQAALALGLKSGDFLAKNIGRNIGIDEVEVESGTTSSGTRQASLVLGKYLSPDLYISYGIGLLEPVSTVRLQYAISSKWKLVTESSGNQSSGDIIYTIERGK